MGFTGKTRSVKHLSRPTLRDVAARAGVSHMTVSNVVNARMGTVQEDTRQRVLEAMRALDYHPSSVARSLSRRRADNLGVVLPNGYFSPFSHSYFSPILDGISKVALHRQQNVTLFTGRVWSNAEHDVAYFRDDRCDGLILLAPDWDSTIVTELHRAGVTLVVIGNHDPAAAMEQVPSVGIDDRAAQFEMTRRMLRTGHRRIAVLLGNTHVAAVHQRVQGHLDALADFGVPHDPELLFQGEFVEPTISERIEAILALPESERPTALCCTNDDMALIAMHALQIRGVNIPAEMSVVGFDDIPAAAAARPALTTVRQPIQELGVKAAEVLLDLIDGVERMENALLLSTSIVERASLASPKAALL